ncbi:hypothetical protein LTR95_014500 [Oleoguttula sp. CCFEE 5521]
MATIFARRPLLAASTTAAAVSTVLYLSRPKPLLADSAYREPTKTLSFPKSMLFAQSLTVVKSEQINHDTKKITFSLPGGANESSGVPSSSAILTQHTPQDAWFPVFRPYTPISSPGDLGTLQLLVKKYPSGRASGHLYSLNPGDKLTVRGPLPGYAYKPSLAQDRSVVLIAGGAGITPIYGLTRAILTEHAGDRTKVQLLWGVNGSRDIVLKDELEDLERRFPERLRVVYAVSSDGVGESGKYRKGYVNEGLLSDAVGECRSQGASWGDEKGTKVFLSGPPKMEDAMAGKGGVLEKVGVTKKEIHRF